METMTSVSQLVEEQKQGTYCNVSVSGQFDNELSSSMFETCITPDDNKNLIIKEEDTTTCIGYDQKGVDLNKEIVNIIVNEKDEMEVSLESMIKTCVNYVVWPTWKFISVKELNMMIPGATTGGKDMNNNFFDQFQKNCMKDKMSFLNQVNFWRFAQKTIINEIKRMRNERNNSVKKIILDGK